MRLIHSPPDFLLGEVLAFKAEDEIGCLDLHAPLAMYHQLCAETPLPCDATDRREYALYMLEFAGSQLQPTTREDGSRLVVIEA